jgi:hypothetical protein
MPFIRRTWTAIEADEWTKEDWIAIVLSPLSYLLLTLGGMLSLLLFWYGYLLLAAGIALTALLHWVIDPKLKAISSEYEKKQQTYLHELEASVRWKTK